MYKEIKNCRICGNTKLTSILNLGEQALTGVFPKTVNEDVPLAPLELVKCDGQTGCGLVQLKHTYSLPAMYGENYGYRSGLNLSMVQHLKEKVQKLLSFVDLKTGDLLVDIGSNDGTLLGSYPKGNYQLVGVDPSGANFHQYYPEGADLIPDFFSAKLVQNKYGGKKAKVVTSIAMFYDLEEPIKFMRDIRDLLVDDGIWVFEQSYLPTMLEAISYDTVCHEHLEYYAFKQTKWMTDQVGLKILDVTFNNVNGGSFSLVVAKKESPRLANDDLIAKLLKTEKGLGLDDLEIYKKFEADVERHKVALLNFISEAQKQGKVIYGYGASTKGNVLLQYCGLSPKEIPFIAEVNEDKFGRFTPGTKIPIISEKDARVKKPDYFMVLPWHFKDNIVKKEQQLLLHGGQLLFPLPRLEVVEK